MSLELVFKLINFSVLPAWFMLIVLPNSTVTKKVVHSVLIPLLLALVYFYFIAWALFFSEGSSEGNFSSLSGVMALFDSPIGTIAGWTHYLVFDLFVGMWIVRDAQRHSIAHLWLVPCLLFTLMFGPLGLALYLLLRMSIAKTGGSLFEDERANSG